MKRWLPLFGIVLVAVLAVVFLDRRDDVPRITPLPVEHATPSPTAKLVSPPASQPTAAAPVMPEPSPAPAAAPPPMEAVPPEREIVERVHARIREFGHRFGGNPEGTNAEITKALDGGNEKGIHFLDAGDLRLNDTGELLDPWGTPYFFHQLSSNQMEVRSAGPDKAMWTDDDELQK